MLPTLNLDLTDGASQMAGNAEQAREAWIDSSLGRMRVHVASRDSITGERLVLQLLDQDGRALEGIGVSYASTPLPADPEDAERTELALSTMDALRTPLTLLLRGTPLCTVRIKPQLSLDEQERILEEEEQLASFRLLHALRTCPTDKILFDTHDERTQAHVRACPSCQERLRTPDRQAWQNLLKLMQKQANKNATVAPLRKQAGQIWSLSPGLAGWDEEGRYMRPPLVLLLRQLPEDGAWRVAQICPETALLGPDDVLLPDASGFVEPWYDYAMADEYLGLYRGQIPAELLNTIKQKIEDADFAEVPRSSLLSSVHRLEVTCASRFARLSLSILLSRTEVVEHATEAWKRANWTASKVSSLHPYAPLAFATPPEQLRALAAADEDHLPVNLYQVIGEGETRLAQVKATLQKCDFSGEAPQVTGSIAGAETLPVHLYAFVELDGEAHAAEHAYWNREANSFAFSFDQDLVKGKRCRVLLAGVSNGDA